MLKLGAAKHAVNDLGDSGGSTSSKLKDFNRVMDDSTVSSARAGDSIIKAGRLIDDTDAFLNNTTRDAGFFERAFASIAGVFGGGGGGGGGLVGDLGASVPLFGSLGTALAALPAIIFIVLFAVNALADALGVLLAVVGDLVAPVTLVTGLLGLLGAGFVLAAQKAFGSGGALSGALAGLKKQFGELTSTLAQDFMPQFKFLAGAASDALTYLDRIAHLPLDQAFKSLATTGVQAVTSFLQQVGSMLAHPIRLAIQLAFGSGPAGNEVSSAVSGLWNQFTQFLLGYTKSHPIEIRPGVFKMMPQTVDGALQPFIDWFNRHDFSAQGFKIANTILAGLKKATGPISTLLSHIFTDATGKALGDISWPRLLTFPARKSIDTIQAAGMAMSYKIRDAAVSAFHSMAAAMTSILGRAWGDVKSAAASAWHYIGNLSGGIINSIAGSISSKLSSAWNAVRSAAANAWNYIKGLFDQVLNVHVNFPSIPSSLKGLIPFTASGGIVTSPQVRVVGEAGPEAIIPLSKAAQHGFGLGGLTVNFYGADLSTPDQQRRVAHIIEGHMMRSWSQASGTI